MEYKNRLTNTEELKKINLQNIQFSVRIRELEAENRALKDEITKLLITKKEKKKCPQCTLHNTQTLTEFAI